MNNLLIHIPHSSYNIPEKYKSLFYISEKELQQEQIKMTDSYTNELFDIKGIKKHIFPISRLICDVERFRNEKDEEMTKRGMWVCYTKTSDCKPLKITDNKHKQEILKLYYDKHHTLFEKLTEQKLKQNKKCLIIDAHSFSSKPLPYELHSKGFRPDICIGADDFHTPNDIIEYFFNSFSELGYTVKIKYPFCGTIVPLKFYRKNKNVTSIMLEINRALYMNEITGNRNRHFYKIQKDIQKIISSYLIRYREFYPDNLI
ncbi:N-formylglutamate amidohydrolase [bacterium]|nr:N-formylglutamate amidohydrolase [bacterium]